MIEESRGSTARRLHLTADRTRRVGFSPLLRLVDTWPAIVSFTPVARFSFISFRSARLGSNPLASTGHDPDHRFFAGYINGNAIDVDCNAGCESPRLNRHEHEQKRRNEGKMRKKQNLNTAAGFSSGSLTKHPFQRDRASFSRNDAPDRCFVTFDISRILETRMCLQTE